MDDLLDDPSDRMLVASLLFLAGGGIIIAGGPAIGVLAALQATGFIASGTVGLSLWTASRPMTDEQQAEIYKSFQQTREVTKQLHDPMGTAVERIRKELGDPSVEDVDVDPKDLFDPPTTKPETRQDRQDKVRGAIGEGLGDLGDALLESEVDDVGRLDTRLERVDSKRDEPSPDPSSSGDNQCRERSDSHSVDFGDHESSFDSSDQDDHPMCEAPPDVEVGPR
jgi:hypothetical protein